MARTFLLSQARTVDRKFREALLSLRIEATLSKDQILALYMNQIYLGSRAYGFEAAAQTYFGKTLASLSVAECAMLAGLPQNPHYANPIRNPERARDRQLVALTRMRNHGVINEAQYARPPRPKSWWCANSRRGGGARRARGRNGARAGVCAVWREGLHPGH